MQNILQNTALILISDYCKQHNIDISGTYIKKEKRGYTYNLIRGIDNSAIGHITLYKNKVPYIYARSLKPLSYAICKKHGCIESNEIDPCNIPF